jgi:hypothetical protein
VNTHDELPPIDFVLTPQDRDKAALAATHLEANRRRQNERDAFRSLARWDGARHRAGERQA